MSFAATSGTLDSNIRTSWG